MLKRNVKMSKVNALQQPSTNDAEPVLPISPEMELAIIDGQRLVAYIAGDGANELDDALTQSIIDAKLALAKGQWTVSEENHYLINYDKLAKTVYPVTVESINAIVPDNKGNSRKPTKAEKSVAWYRRYTLVALTLMLAAQLYWLVGNNLRVNLKEIFLDREVTTDLIGKASGNDIEKQKLEQTLKIQNQEFDANYRLLKTWNKVWLMGGDYSEGLPSYFAARYEHEKSLYAGQPDKLNDLDLKRKLHEVRIVYFAHILSADFMLDAFQGYILPLLYGLLGAFIYVLRCLMGEIKALTYTFDSEIRYRLRLTLGALGGMIIGWFLKPDDAGSLASLSPMALAFLMGYNVDLLFSFMDKLIDNIKQSLDKPAGKDKTA